MRDASANVSDCMEIRKADAKALVRFADGCSEKTPGPLSEVTLRDKDRLDVAGMPTACGSPIPSNMIARTHPEPVARAIGAGAPVVGKTVTAENATPQPGPTVNPLDSRQTPGGSSSGSAAAAGAGVISHSPRTQTAGSVIRPAASCGVEGPSSLGERWGANPKGDARA